MLVTLNIGLAHPRMSPQLVLLPRAMSFIIQQFDAAYFEFRGDLDEPTLVVLLKDPQVKVPSFEHRIDYLCEVLEQDCVAVLYAFEQTRRRHGILIGPRKAAWEPFDISKFVTPTVRFS